MNLEQVKVLIGDLTLRVRELEQALELKERECQAMKELYAPKSKRIDGKATDVSDTPSRGVPEVASTGS